MANTDQPKDLPLPPQGAKPTQIGDGSVMWSWTNNHGQPQLELVKDGHPVYKLSENPWTKDVSTIWANGTKSQAYSSWGRLVTETVDPKGTVDRSTILPDAFVNRDGHPDIIGGIATGAEKNYRLTGAKTYETAVSVTADPDLNHKPGTYADNGYAVLKPPKFSHEYLLLPTAPITGIEDPHILDPGKPNYFAAAIKDAGTFTMNSFKPGELPADAIDPKTGQVRRDFLGYAANSMDWRSQDRLHIHADVLDAPLRDQLKTQVDLPPGSKDSIVQGKWTDLNFDVHNNHYISTWTNDTGPNHDQLSVDPVKLLHDKLASENGGVGTRAGENYANAHMGEHSILVVGESRTNPDGTVTNGHVIIVGTVNQDYTHSTKDDFKNDRQTYDGGFAEEWLKGHSGADQ